MPDDFRARLSFSSFDHNASFKRENWREAVALLPIETEQKTPSLFTHLPTVREYKNKTGWLEWVIMDDSYPTCVIFAPYFVDNMTTYRVPSFNHLLNHINLNQFDDAWVLFFMQYFPHDKAQIVLDSQDVIHDIVWALTCAGRVRLATNQTCLSIGYSLQLKARLRYSEEWSVWALDAELILPTGEIIAPEDLDFITQSGLVVHDNTLHFLPTGATWIVQLLASGAWFIAQDYLTEALYQLSHRIRDGEFLQNLPQIHCVRKTPIPIIYLRSKNFDKQTLLTFYLAYRYDNTEVFSNWHSQDETNVPIAFEATNDIGRLYFRDLDYENDMVRLIQQAPEAVFNANKRAWTVHISVLWQLIPLWLGNGCEVWAEKHKIDELSTFGIAVESGIGWFELQAFDMQAKQVIDPIQLIKYLKRQSLFIQLGNGKICVLPERWIAHLTQFLDIGQSNDVQGWHFSSIYAQEINDALNQEATFEADDAFHETVERMQSFGKITPLTQPEGFRALLRPYQLEGLTWLNLLSELHIGGILADDMGLGKTVQILALLQHRIINQTHLTPQQILVICPKSVQNHWVAQANNLIPRLSTHILNSRTIEQLGQPKQHQLLFASYGLIRHHIDSLSSYMFDLVILDEAQMIKNVSSQTTQAIRQLSATQRFALTGTPIENRFEELASIFLFLNPYTQLHASTTLSTPDAVRDLVQKALHPFVLRRLKEDTLTDLPLKHVHNMVLPMTPEQGRLYYELSDSYRDEMSKRQAEHELPTQTEAAFFLEGLLRLRQVATYPNQLTKEQFQPCTSNKLIYLCEQVPILIANGHRIVIFSQFLSFLKDLSDDLQALDIPCAYVDGKTVDREETIALFQSNTHIKVLLISLRVGGVGIDLTSADICIIADPWWNDAVEKQAIDRLHRYGQQKTVTVFRLISENSIEEKMDILKRNKSALADAIGKTDPNFLENLKWDDFKVVF